ncbi:hypothetical protein EV424DRAFT_1590538 [Suillus variegatus]|nr:hypothetical protein EV424DRAFT_1590538 [Suillus variegatus]
MKHNVMQALRTGSGVRECFIKELYPDAVNRGDGRSLAADDAGSEKSLAQALHSVVRAANEQRYDDGIDDDEDAEEDGRGTHIENYGNQHVQEQL